MHGLHEREGDVGVTELCEIARKWTTDKALYYTPVYHELLKDRRWTTRKVLEFGIGYPDLMLKPAARIGARYYIAGASLFMWEEYFPKAEIFALDNRHLIFINSGRIHSFYCDQGNESSYGPAIADVGDDFDLIVEDGSHEQEHQLLSLRMLFPLLKKGGIYIMEDAPVDDDDFLERINFPFQVYDFKDNPADPARVIVLFR